MRFLKKVLIFCFAALLTYTTTAIIFQASTGAELSPTLTERFFTVFGIELAVMAALKIAEYAKEAQQKRKKKKPPPPPDAKPPSADVSAMGFDIMPTNEEMEGEWQ